MHPNLTKMEPSGGRLSITRDTEIPPRQLQLAGMTSVNIGLDSLAVSTWGCSCPRRGPWAGNNGIDGTTLARESPWKWGEYCSYFERIGDSRSCHPQKSWKRDQGYCLCQRALRLHPGSYGGVLNSLALIQSPIPAVVAWCGL